VPVKPRRWPLLPPTIYPATSWRGISIAGFCISAVADRKSVAEAPPAVHNIGEGTREEDILLRFSVIGHYRLPAAATSSPVVSH